MKKVMKLQQELKQLLNQPHRDGDAVIANLVQEIRRLHGDGESYTSYLAHPSVDELIPFLSDDD